MIGKLWIKLLQMTGYDKNYAKILCLHPLCYNTWSMGLRIHNHA